MAGLSDFMATDKGAFVQLAMGWLSKILIVVLVGHLVRMGLWGWENEKLHVYKTVTMWFFLWNCLHYYVNPIPGLGVGFADLLTHQTQNLAHVLSNQSESIVYQTMVDFEHKLTSSLPFDPSFQQLARYWFLEIILNFCEGIIWMIVSWGFEAMALTKVFGPLFLPWGLLPSCAFVMWGWIRSHVQYSFYPVAATGYLVITARMLTYVSSHYLSTQYLSTADTWVNLGPVVVTFMGLAYGAIQIPSFVSSMFSGRAGEAGVAKWLRSRF